ncbi:MAG: Na(+)-translocating NADH-quinone reductase subunit C [Planctomycetes bacterium]|nr:Na(+)-translocating NADH-quinone reductase subunit C [Planctomycetota bacterium]
MQRDSIANTFTVAILLCVVCSVMVSTAAVLLRPAQERNKLLERKRNILQVAGLYTPDKPLEELFKQVETRIVDLNTGRFVDSSVVDPQTYNQRTAARDLATSERIPEAEDIAGIGRREEYSFVYLVKKDGKLSQIVLPVYGKGLWSTIYGFLALDADWHTIDGITFYEQGETPGLGGEIENPNWKKKWIGKQAFDPERDVRIEVIRGEVNKDSPESKYQIDGLAGATITSRGVSHLVQFWLGPDGFGPLLDRLRKETSPAKTAGEAGVAASPRHDIDATQREIAVDG